jgi:predicted kinase
LTDKNVLILLRGLPGSGKTTLAKVLSENGKYPVHSIDSYFTNEIGEYYFEFDKNHLAYKNCEELTRNSLGNKVEKVFVDNTFTIDWEFEPYFKLASEYDYLLFVVTVENYHGNKNIHDTSLDQLEKMALKYKVKLM